MVWTQECLEQWQLMVIGGVVDKNTASGRISLVSSLQKPACMCVTKGHKNYTLIWHWSPVESKATRYFHTRRSEIYHQHVNLFNRGAKSTETSSAQELYTIYYKFLRISCHFYILAAMMQAVDSIEVNSKLV